MNAKNVKPGMRVRVFDWSDYSLPARRDDQGAFRTVRWNEPVNGPGRAGRRVTFDDGSTIQVETMADLIVEGEW